MEIRIASSKSRDCPNGDIYLEEAINVLLESGFTLHGYPYAVHEEYETVHFQAMVRLPK